MKLKKRSGIKCRKFFFVSFFLCFVVLFLNVSRINAGETQDFSVAEIQCVWRNVDRIVVVGDLHGAYESFVKILKQTGLVDDLLQWTGGNTHLVQMGDILDRGDRAR